MFSIETASASETEALAAQLGALLSPGLVITLSGELGAGKTVFVRGLARGLGLTGAVTSPSYVLQHVYRGARLALYHLDAYRLTGGLMEFEASGLHEALADDQAAVCVEWPERLGAVQWPAERLEVQFEHIEPQRRRLVLKAFGPRAEALLMAVASRTENGRWQMADGKGQMADGKGQMADGKGQMADGKGQMQMAKGRSQ